MQRIEIWLARAPFARILFPFLMGMCVPGAERAGNVLAVFALTGLSLYYFVPVLRHSWRIRRLPAAMVFLLYAVLGNQWMEEARRKVTMPERYRGEELLFCAELLEPPVEKPRSRQCSVRIVQCAAEPTFLQRKVMLYLAPDSKADSLLPADRLWVSAALEDFENFTEEFDYHSYMKNKGYTARAYVKNSRWRPLTEVEMAALPPPDRRARAVRLRERLVEQYRFYGLENENLALLSALSLGKKDGLDAESRSRFASAGVAHILAVSGMHVGIVYLYVDRCLALLLSGMGWLWTKRKRPPAARLRFARATLFIRRLGVVAVLWIYAYVTGLSPSVIRSVTMFSLSSAASCLGRRTQSWNSLCVTAFLMLCVRPLLLFDLSFQMSFAAVASILMFLPAFQEACRLPMVAAVQPELFQPASPASRPEPPRRRTLPLLWWRLVQVFGWGREYFLTLMLMSLAAQMGTAPLSVYYFHQFPNYFLLSNLLLVPLAVLLTYGALAFLSLSLLPMPLFGWLCRLLAGLLDCGLGFFSNYAAWVDARPGACDEHLLLSLSGMVGLYMLLLAVFGLFRSPRYRYGLEQADRRLKSGWQRRRRQRKVWGKC